MRISGEGRGEGGGPRVALGAREQHGARRHFHLPCCHISATRGAAARAARLHPPPCPPVSLCAPPISPRYKLPISCPACLLSNYLCVIYGHRGFCRVEFLIGHQLAASHTRLPSESIRKFNIQRSFLDGFTFNSHHIDNASRLCWNL